MGLDGVKHVVLVLSGKGGVGKSTVSASLALSLQQLGFKVGLLDIDLCGPSIPKIFDLNTHSVEQGHNGWIPVPYSREGKPDLSLMSIGFLLSTPDTAIIWRGPKKHAMIRQFLTDVDWSELDYLLIDTPPGTSDEHISVCETLQAAGVVDGSILVSTPQALSISDVRREISFCRTANIPIFGLVANFAGYECEHCSECTNIFSVGGVEKLAEYSKLEVLASIPIDPKLGECCDTGKNFLDLYQGSRTSEIILKLAQTVVDRCE